MNVLALLPEPSLTRLRVAFGTAHGVAVATDLDGASGLAAHLAAGDVDLAVIDPGDPRLERRTRTLALLCAQHATVPVLLYTPLTPASIAAAAQLLRGGTRELLIAGREDQPGALRATVLRVALHTLAARFLAAVPRPMALLPPSVERAVRELFTSPRRFRSVEDIALAAAVTRRHLARVARGAGFASCRSLLAAARVLSAHGVLRQTHCSLHDAAAQLAADPRVLTHHIRRVAGVATARELVALDPDELLGRCVRAVCRPLGVVPRPARSRRTRSSPLV